MNAGADFLDGWRESQQKFMNTWIEGTKNFQASFAGLDEKAENPAGDPLGLYNTWILSAGKYFDDIIKNYPFQADKSNFEKMFKGADAYVKIYEFWKPVYDSMKSNSFDIDACKDMLDPTKYKEVMDKVFSFNSPDALSAFYGDASKLINTWGVSAEELVKPWLDTVKKNGEIFPGFMSGKTDDGMKMFDNFQETFGKTFGKTLNIPALGKDREKVELTMQCLEKYSEYMKKNSSFQNKMYATGQSAMQKLVEESAKKFKAGAEIKSYDEFFKLWIDVNENCFGELFSTDEFSKIQAEMLESALDVKKYFNQLIEVPLSDYPIALRSEMDDLYKTIYELKKKIKSLEKEVKNAPVKGA